MKVFHLTQRKCGRIVLVPSGDTVDPNTVLDIIKAKDWVSARAKVDETPYYNTQGHGWLLV